MGVRYEMSGMKVIVNDKKVVKCRKKEKLTKSRRLDGSEIVIADNIKYIQYDLFKGGDMC